MLYLTVFYALFLAVVALETDLTVDVGAGKMECFFQKIKKATGLEVEYQVVVEPVTRHFRGELRKQLFQSQNGVSDTRETHVTQHSPASISSICTRNRDNASTRQLIDTVFGDTF